MKLPRMFTVMTLLVAVAGAGTALCADMGASYGFDLDALWTAARQTYDLDTEDAVVLLENREVTLTDGGELATTVHRVVWINSSTAIHQYADLRVPWNQANSRLDVEVLRTWRDDRWWPDPTAISETAVVETLPYAVDHADDYTTLRETMLLHDGIELPCILETRYTITRRGVPAAEGVFVFPQPDPAVQVGLTVTTPASAPWHAQAVNGAPEPTVTTDDGQRRTQWHMGPVARLGQPVADEPEAYEPAVIYSTWESWAALGRDLTGAFDLAAHVDGALADTLTARTAHLHDPLALAQAALDLAQESTRRINYDFRLWGGPRPAVRTWETAYGHDLDRMVLAAGLVRSLAVLPQGGGGSNLAADVVLLGHGTVAIAPEVPRLGQETRLALDIGLPGDLRLLWTPDGKLHGAAWALGRPAFLPAGGEPVFTIQTEVPNLVAADLTLTPTVDEGWSWSGILTSRGVFSYHGAVITGRALDKAATAALGDVLPDADLDGCNPREFSPLAVTVTCQGTLAGPDENDDGDFVLTVGDPGDGVLKRLPGDIHPYQSERTSRALITPMGQKIHLQVPLDGFTAKRLPRTMEVDNGAGRFAVSAQVEDGRLYYKRTLRLTGKGSWPELRALLLEAGDKAHRDIVLHPGGES